jgi:hypothetical protein
MAEFSTSIVNANGWLRLGAATGIGLMFLTPMLWALGMFGASQEAIPRAVVFGVCGMLFGVSTLALIGWAMKGFVVRQKRQQDDDDDSPKRPAVPRPSSAPPPGNKDGKRT